MNKVGDVFRTCTGQELQSLTSSGWELYEIHSQSNVKEGGGYSDYVQMNGYNQNVFRTHPNIVVQEIVFVLRRSRDEEMNRLREELAKTHSLSEERRLKAEEQSKESEKLSKKLEKSELDVAQSISNAKYHLDRAEKAEKVKMKLEEDIAKLRNEIGAARFREILGREQVRIVDERDGKA